MHDERRDYGRKTNSQRSEMRVVLWLPFLDLSSQVKGAVDLMCTKHGRNGQATERSRTLPGGSLLAACSHHCRQMAIALVRMPSRRSTGKRAGHCRIEPAERCVRYVLRCTSYVTYGVGQAPVPAYQADGRRTIETTMLRKEIYAGHIRACVDPQQTPDQGSDGP